MQCDRSQVLISYRCQGGLDTEDRRGTCVAKPAPVDTTIPPCTRCGLCLNNVRASVEVAALNTTITPVQLASSFYTACSAANYSLTACASVQAAITSSYKGNLARRAGALCLRLGECSSSLTTDATCTLSSAATGAIVIDAVAAPAAVSNLTVNATETANATETINNTTGTVIPAIPLARGMLDACTVEGVSTGMRVAGTFKLGTGKNMSLLVVCLAA
jgi:hypothetical protein